MKRIVLLLVLIINVVGAQAQHFKHYLRVVLGKEEKTFRYYKTGLLVLDDNGNELRWTELLYEKIAYSDGFAHAAVELPLISLENGREMGTETGLVWICLNYELEPVFIFPQNTQHVEIVEGMFLYEDKPGHYSTVGLIDKDGKIIFEAPYSRIYFEEKMYVGVKDITGYHNTENTVWKVDYRIKDSDESFEINLETPDYLSSTGLRFVVEEPGDELLFKEILAGSPFQRGLYHVVHFKIDEAIKCFREALNDEDPRIVKCAKYNIKALRSFRKKYFNKAIT